MGILTKCQRKQLQTYIDGFKLAAQQTVEKGYKVDTQDIDIMISNLGYTKIEENDEFVKFCKIESYGYKVVDIYLSSDGIALVTCYDQLTDKAMALTYTEMNAFTSKMYYKFKPTWSVSVS